MCYVILYRLSYRYLLRTFKPLRFFLIEYYIYYFTSLLSSLIKAILKVFNLKASVLKASTLGFFFRYIIVAKN